MYIRKLRHSHIQFRERNDEIVWDFDPLGTYSPEVGYLNLSVFWAQMEEILWWRKL